MLWPTSAPLAPPSVSESTSADTGRNAIRRAPGKKAKKVTAARLDPTLELDLLRQSEQIKYAGTARNIFVAGSMPVPHDSGIAKATPPPYVAPMPAPPPPINLKFFGFA